MVNNRDCDIAIVFIQSYLVFGYRFSLSILYIKLIA